LRHTDVRVTLGTYGHLFVHREEDLNRRLEKVYGRAVKKAAAASSRPEVVDIEEVREQRERSTRENSVDPRGFEPLTSSMPWKHSTN
jgi:hypothetical protein